MIITNNSTQGRVEVTFNSERHEDGTVTISQTTATTPVNGKGTQWSKTTYATEDLFTVDALLVPSLLAALGWSLALTPGDHA
jgi:hypothetical protein